MVHTAYSAHCTSDSVVDVLISEGSLFALCSNYGLGLYNITSLNNILNTSGINLFLSSEVNVKNLRPEGIEYDPNLKNVVMSSVGSGQISGVSASSFQAYYDQILVYVNGSSQVIHITLMSLISLGFFYSGIAIRST